MASHPVPEPITVYTVHSVINGEFSKTVWMWSRFDFGLVVTGPNGDDKDGDDGDAVTDGNAIDIENMTLDDAEINDQLSSMNVFDYVYMPWLSGYLSGVLAGVQFTDQDGFYIYRDFEKKVWFRSYKQFTLETVPALHYHDRDCQHPIIKEAGIVCEQCQLEDQLDHVRRLRDWEEMFSTTQSWLTQGNMTFARVPEAERSELEKEIVRMYPILNKFTEVDGRLMCNGQTITHELIQKHKHHLHRRPAEPCILCTAITTHLGYGYEYDYDPQRDCELGTCDGSCQKNDKN